MFLPLAVISFLPLISCVAWGRVRKHVAARWYEGAVPRTF
jgi:hypothetical protein